MEENKKIIEEQETEKNEKKSKKKEIIIITLTIIVFVIISGIFRIVINNMSQVSVAAKPIIYIYPKEETRVTVKLGKKENITCSYPKYYDGWNVTAYPDGTLIDNETGKALYSLYWEGIRDTEIPMNDGFIVKSEESAKFLEEKLAILGLNEKESEEFIIYWLPKLESHKYNFIRFETMEEIEKNMPLDISKKPDTLIRVWMQFKGIDKEIEVPMQKLEKINRVGYTVVEWGGTEIN